MFWRILEHYEVLLSSLFHIAGEHGTSTWEERKTRMHEFSWIIPPLYDPFINRIQTHKHIICVEKRPHVFILKRTKKKGQSKKKRKNKKKKFKINSSKGEMEKVCLRSKMCSGCILNN